MDQGTKLLFLKAKFVNCESDSSHRNYHHSYIDYFNSNNNFYELDMYCNCNPQVHRKIIQRSSKVVLKHTTPSKEDQHSKMQHHQYYI